MINCQHNRIYHLLTCAPSNASSRKFTTFSNDKKLRFAAPAGNNAATVSSFVRVAAWDSWLVIMVVWFMHQLLWNSCLPLWSIQYPASLTDESGSGSRNCTLAPAQPSLFGRTRCFVFSGFDREPIRNAGGQALFAKSAQLRGRPSPNIDP